MLAPRGDSGAAVKVQYFGDVNDYRKFTLLRLLSDVGGFKISVCWMLTEPDDSKEGGNRKYLEQAANIQKHILARSLPPLADGRHVETVVRVEEDEVSVGERVHAPGVEGLTFGQFVGCGFIEEGLRRGRFHRPRFAVGPKAEARRHLRQHLEESWIIAAPFKSPTTTQPAARFSSISNSAKRCHARRSWRRRRQSSGRSTLMRQCRLSTHRTSCSFWRPALSTRSGHRCRGRVRAGRLAAEILLACYIIRSCLRTAARPL
jgi:hypothetical protein